MHRGTLLFPLLLVQLFRQGKCLHEVHKIRSLQTWVYVTKFCFLPIDGNEQTAGVFRYNITFPANNTLSWQVYHDGDSGWEKIRTSDEYLSCFHRTNLAKSQGNSFGLSDHLKEKIKEADTSLRGYGGTRSVSNYLVFNSDRPRWFYFTLANCDSDVDQLGHISRTYHGAKEFSITADIELTMVNGNGPQKHFSADEIGKLPLYQIFFALYVLLSLSFMYIRKKLIKKQMFHHTVKLLFASINLELISLIWGLVYQNHYASEGYKLILLQCLQHTFHAAADISLLLFLLLIGKGWSVVRKKISAMGRVKIAIFSTSYIFITYF